MPEADDDDASLAAAKVALLALTGSIHPSMRVGPNAFILLPARGTVLTRERMVEALRSLPKPQLCRVYASHGMVALKCDFITREHRREAFDLRRVDDLVRFAALERFERQRKEADGFLDHLVSRSGAQPEAIRVCCTGRGETLIVSLETVRRFRREYALVRESWAEDDPDNELARDRAEYRYAREQKAAAVIRFSP